ncbi:MAG: hypothetical protein ACRCWJ_05970 [Casimicrobium sp.]
MISRLISAFAAPIVCVLAGLVVALGVALWRQTDSLSEAQENLASQNAAIKAQNEAATKQLADAQARVTFAETQYQLTRSEIDDAIKSSQDQARRDAGSIDKLRADIDRLRVNAARGAGCRGAPDQPAAAAERSFVPAIWADYAGALQDFAGGVVEEVGRITIALEACQADAAAVRRAVEAAR